jgi:hypothetical protein
VKHESDPVAAVEEVDQDAAANAAAKSWLENIGGCPELPTNWEAILTAKGTAQELYVEQKIMEACQATTAALQALRRLESQVQDTTNSLADDMDVEASGAVEQPHHRTSQAEIDNLRGILHSNRSLLLLHLVQSQDAAVVALGVDAAWRLVLNDTDLALRENPTNFKASFRRARALLELGELDEALQDATNVVDHYAMTSATPNPEAAELRERVLQAIKKERGKWGEKGPRQWNRGTKDLIREISCKEEDAGSTKENRHQTRSANIPGDPKKQIQLLSSQRLATRPLDAPKTGADIEKALLVTLKTDKERQLAYVREHISVAALRRHFKRAPMGPDLISRLIHITADLAEEDCQLAGEITCALASVPSAKTDAAMFDADEQEVLQRLISRTGPSAAEAWAD